MRTFWLIALFVLSASGAAGLTLAIGNLLPDPPPPVQPIDLATVTVVPPASAAPPESVQPPTESDAPAPTATAIPATSTIALSATTAPPSPGSNG